LVARIEFWARDGNLEVRQWHWERGAPGKAFWNALEKAAKRFMRYASAKTTSTASHIDGKVRDLFASLSAKGE
ncbi:MAG TPA: hypothetical protein VG820_00045, partial [Fimbriimonadaceae bacterium]|nr:hypothetical protein [Fimbriimonadaceae bacterium]